MQGLRDDLILQVEIEASTALSLGQLQIALMVESLI